MRPSSSGRVTFSGGAAFLWLDILYLTRWERYGRKDGFGSIRGAGLRVSRDDGE